MVVSTENITISISNIFGEKIYLSKEKNYPNDNREQILKNIFDAVDKAIIKTNIQQSQIYLFSIGTHGVVNPETYIITDAPYLKGWNGIDLASIFKSKYNKKVLIEKDVNLGAIGEQWKNRNRIKDMIFININFGVGAAIIIDNQILLGNRGQMEKVNKKSIMLAGYTTSLPLHSSWYQSG